MNEEQRVEFYQELIHFYEELVEKQGKTIQVLIEHIRETRKPIIIHGDTPTIF